MFAFLCVCVCLCVCVGVFVGACVSCVHTCTFLYMFVTGLAVPMVGARCRLPLIYMLYKTI